MSIRILASDFVKDFSKLEKRFAVSFKNKDLLTKAFVHRSYVNENKNFKLGHNERLEFLGDAVLELVTTVYVFKKYPQEPEGVLTSYRAGLVNTKMLADVASNLDFYDFLLLSRGEEKEKGKAREDILADTFEAFIGALYLDQGYKKCKDFIEKNLILKRLPSLIKGGHLKDTKSLFQEIAQAKEGITPTYRSIKEWGPDHAKHFLVGLFLEDEIIAKGEGCSKQEAELKAAENALKMKKWQA